MTKWEQEAISYELENRDLKTEVTKLRCRIDETERVRHRIEDLESQNSGIQSLSSLPKTLSEVLEAVAKLFSSRIEIAESAIKSADDYSKKTNGLWGKSDRLAIAWELVFSLATKLYDIKYHQNEPSLEQMYNSAFSKFELALTEGKQTNLDSGLMKLRKVPHNGQEIEITPHLKYGTQKNELLRLHFAIANDSKQFIVGHFGDHLDTYSTRKL